MVSRALVLMALVLLAGTIGSCSSMQEVTQTHTRVRERSSGFICLNGRFVVIYAKTAESRGSAIILKARNLAGMWAQSRLQSSKPCVGYGQECAFFSDKFSLTIGLSATFWALLRLTVRPPKDLDVDASE